MSVLIESVLHFLMAKSCVASSLGNQLDQMRDFGSPLGESAMKARPRVPDPYAARDNEERRIFEQAPIIRCLDDFARIKDSKIFKDKPDIEALQKAVPSRSHGELAIMVLRAYQEWATTSPNRALVAVYELAHSLAPQMYPSILHTEATTAHAFSVDRGSAANARKKASSLYADSLLALSSWTVSFNRRKMHRVG